MGGLAPRLGPSRRPSWAELAPRSVKERSVGRVGDGEARRNEAEGSKAAGTSLGGRKRQGEEGGDCCKGQRE